MLDSKIMNKTFGWILLSTNNLLTPLYETILRTNKQESIVYVCTSVRYCPSYILHGAEHGLKPHVYISLRWRTVFYLNLNRAMSVYITYICIHRIKYWPSRTIYGIYCLFVRLVGIMSGQEFLTMYCVLMNERRNGG